MFPFDVFLRALIIAGKANKAPRSRPLTGLPTGGPDFKIVCEHAYETGKTPAKKTIFFRQNISLLLCSNVAGPTFRR